MPIVAIHIIKFAPIMKKEIIDSMYQFSVIVVNSRSKLNYLRSLKRMQSDATPVKNVQLFIHNNLSEKLSGGHGFTYDLPPEIIEKVLDIAIAELESVIENCENTINKLRSELC